MARSKRAGFTLVEIMIVVAIVAIGAAIAVASMSRSQSKSDLRGAASDLVSMVKRARSLARSGAVPVTTWPANARTRTAGIRVITATRYVVFADNDDQANGAASEAVVEMVDLPTKYNGTMTIQEAPGFEVRFKANGTLTVPNDQTLTLLDASGGGQRTVTITFGGNASYL